jgi:prepilin-type N-terminal cleavage/methylation domain-containing protein
MPSFMLSDRAKTRRGFTITELLVAMALIVLIMSILSQAFVEGLETFRHLKGIGDLQERLRTAAIDLREDVRLARVHTDDFVFESLRTGTADPKAAAALRNMFEAICAEALDLNEGLREVERQTTNPVARRILGRALDALALIKAGATLMVELLDLINPPPPPPPPPPPDS